MMNVFVRLFLCLVLAGCTAATPSVTSLGGAFAPFTLNQGEIRVKTVGELANVVIVASCRLAQTEFEVEFPDATPVFSWSPVPTSTMSPPFVSVLNACASNQTLTLTLDLQSYADFSSIIGNNGAYRTVRFRDKNITGISFSDEIKITYSLFDLKKEQFILGQGNNNPICRNSLCLRGRVVNRDQTTQVTSGSYSLKGRVVYQ